MFNNYNDKVKYIAKKTTTDMFGYGNSEPVEKAVRYCGGINKQVPKNNSIITEHRLIYQCPFEVNEGDKFIVDDKELIIKQVERTVDIFSKTVFWEAELL